MSVGPLCITVVPAGGGPIRYFAALDFSPFNQSLTRRNQSRRVTSLTPSTSVIVVRDRGA
jgi:hypothetical protein